MFTLSIVGLPRSRRSFAWSSVAVLAVLVAGSSARAQFNPADLDPFNRNSAIRKELDKADPTAALRHELDNARKAAMRDLRKLDPEEVFRRVQRAVQTRVSAQLHKSGVKYDKRSGEADLRGSEMGKVLTHGLGSFAQGNKRASRVEEFSFNVKTRRLIVRLYVRHCQSWGKIIPGQGEVDLYSVTQRAAFRYDFRTGSGDFDIDLGPLAPRINTQTLKKLQEGDLVGIAEALAPEVVGKLWNHEEKNEYAQRLDQYRRRYGAGNVYFASKKFVDWAGPETIGKYVLNGVVTGGTSVYPQIMHDLRTRAKEELPALSDWLARHGMANGESAALQLLTGHTPRWPFLKFEMIPVRYSSREKPLHAVTTPWRNVDHLAFVIVWTDEGRTQGAAKAPTVPLGGSQITSRETKKVTMKNVHVRFMNQTSQNVTLHLHGSEEVSSVLQPGHERSFRIAINSEKGLTASFNTSRDQSLSLPVHEGGAYRFRMIRGQVRLIGQ